MIKENKNTEGFKENLQFHRTKLRLQKIYMKEIMISTVCSLAGISAFFIFGFKCVEMMGFSSTQGPCKKVFIALLCLTIVMEGVILSFITVFLLNVLSRIKRINNITRDLRKK